MKRFKGKEGVKVSALTYEDFLLALKSNGANLDQEKGFNVNFRDYSVTRDCERRFVLAKDGKPFVIMNEIRVLVISKNLVYSVSKDVFEEMFEPIK